jgi:alpha-L-fucosidase
MWGYKIIDQNYKSPETLVRYLVSAAGKGANLLLNVGPQANGELPAAAVERMKAMGEWLDIYGQTIYGTEAGDVKQQQWGCTTRKGDKLYVHIFDLEDEMLYLPLDCKVTDAKVYLTGDSVKVERVAKGVVLNLGRLPKSIDYVVELTTK